MNVTAQGTDPLSLLNAVVAAYNSGDVERATALYAADAVITNTRGRKFPSKEAIRQFIQTSVNARIHLEVENPQVAGDAVTWTDRESTDSLVRLGIAPVEIKIQLVAQGGKIKADTRYYPPKSLARVRRACKTPQAQDVLLFGQSCSEFIQHAKAQTESVAANLKPYSVEMDFMSLQGYLSPITR
jgi:hypothetical protein